MPVERIKEINTLNRAEIDEVAYLLEFITSDIEVFNQLNDWLADDGAELLDFKNLEAALEALTPTVDRVVVVEDEIDES